MFYLATDILLTNLIYILTGKYFYFKYFNLNNEDAIQSGVLGVVIVSFISLLLNFFVPLNEYLRLTYIILVIVLFLQSKLHFQNQDKVFLVISSLFTFLLLIYSNEYRPDAGLYHIPYIQIINENKIILGLSNLHSRFGHVSIIQYLSAFNYSIFLKEFATLIPLGSLVSFVTIYFFYDLLKYLKKKEKFTIGKLFSLIILIYISYKINRYSEFGNDAPAHIFFFYLISYFLNIKNYSYKDLYLSSLYSVFIFSNKVFMGLSFIIPLYIFSKNLSYFKKIFFSLPTLFITLLILKNILVSGCLIYPAHSFCFENLKWSQDIEKIKSIEIEAEAWSKAWPENKNDKLNIENFSENFNWIDAWKSKHLKFIVNLILPYIILIIIIFLYIKSYSFKNKNNQIYLINYKDKKLIVIFTLSIIGIIFFFLKFPIYRYGYSYVLFFIYTVSIFLVRNIDENKFYKVCTIIIIICFLSLNLKQAIRVFKNFEKSNYLPDHIVIDEKNLKTKYVQKKMSGDMNIYYSANECFYGKAPCTNYKENFEKIDHNIKFGYDIFYIKN